MIGRTGRVARPRRTKRHALGRTLVAALVAIAFGGVGLFEGPRLIGHADATTVAGSPSGLVEHMWFMPGGLRIAGWTVDPNTTAPITMYVTVDGSKAGSVLADDPRPDIAAARTAAGPNHGFYLRQLISEGKHTICVWAKNVGAGADTQLRCQTRVLDYGPVGTAEHITAASGAVVVSGWTFDYDQPTAPLTVRIKVDSTTTNFVASDSRSDIAAQYPTAGAGHGFSQRFTISQGTHTVCVSAVNLGYGSDNTLRCSTFTLNESPRGHVDVLGQASGKLHLTGWAFDPDAPTSAATVTVSVDKGAARAVPATGLRADVGKAYPGTGDRHGFDQLLTLSEGSHSVCVTVRNVSFGSDKTLVCRTVVLRFTPTAALDVPTRTGVGIHLSGWASDPDTSKPITVRLTSLGRTTTLTADGTGSSHSGHRFSVTVPMTSGSHAVCATGVNVLYGRANSPAACRTVNFAYSPLGYYDSLTRASGSSGVVVKGWALDADTTAALSVGVTVDGVARPNISANLLRTDVAAKYGSVGPNHGFVATVSATDGEHTVCLTAHNAGGGADTSLGCKLIIAVHPVAPSAPRGVTAVADYGSATVTWTKPASDGGAPWSKYVITSTPATTTVAVGATITAATFTGLKAGTSYTFTVQAVNVAGASAGAQSAAVKTPTGVPPQTTPAPVSTSRYIRNIRGSSATELSTMRSEGAADARANPSGHSYLILLDIGGQDQFDGGVVLSATTRFVSYTDLVRDIQAYTDGYHSGQRASAPVTIAIGTNNDMDVTSAAGQAWADRVVDPIVAYAKKYAGMRIAGANDVEPGFRATYSQTRSWLSGYLAHTSAPFVFNGSADGCAWTAVNRGCNNGWSMAGLYYLAAGAAPNRLSNLPQIYNYTMADQWKYISLTGVAQGNPRINFAGTLTEWTACDQSNSCGSLTGRTAWSKMWSNLQSDSRLKVGSLPYATDLRIDK
jgi:Fibronectin type III domain